MGSGPTWPKGLPREAPLTPPKERAEPDASYMEVKCLERRQVAREAKAGAMPPQHPDTMVFGASERQHLSDVAVAAARGWKSTKTLNENR